MDNTNEIDKVHKKVPKWFRLPLGKQKNSTILTAFMKLSNDRGVVSYGQLKTECRKYFDNLTDVNFYSHIYSMSKQTHEHNHAQVFEWNDDEVKLNSKVKEFIIKTYQDIINKPNIKSRQKINVCIEADVKQKSL
jgi:hypothetical protein